MNNTQTRRETKRKNRKKQKQRQKQTQTTKRKQRTLDTNTGQMQKKTDKKTNKKSKTKQYLQCCFRVEGQAASPLKLLELCPHYSQRTDKGLFFTTQNRRPGCVAAHSHHNITMQHHNTTSCTCQHHHSPYHCNVQDVAEHGHPFASKDPW